MNNTELLSIKFNELQKTLTPALEDKITAILKKGIVDSESMGWNYVYDEIRNLSLTKEQLDIFYAIDGMIEDDYEYMEEPNLLDALLNYDSGFWFY